MKALLIVSVLCLIIAAPSVSAADNPVCPDTGLKQCAIDTASQIFGGCNPWYNYFRECEPYPTS